MDALYRRRAAELDACATRHDVDLVHARWLAEDQAAAAARDPRNQALAKLQARVDQLERERAAFAADLGKLVGKTIKAREAVFVEAQGEVLARAKAELRTEFEQRLAQEVERVTKELTETFEQRMAIPVEVEPPMRFKGTWKAERAYAPGDTVNDRNSLWVCQDPVGPGADRPEGGQKWKLAVKRGSQDRARDT
jgi:hypothetical protein